MFEGILIFLLSGRPEMLNGCPVETLNVDADDELVLLYADVESFCGEASTELVLSSLGVELVIVEDVFMKREGFNDLAFLPPGASSGECRARLLFWRSISKSFSNSMLLILSLFNSNSRSASLAINSLTRVSSVFIFACRLSIIAFCAACTLSVPS